MTHSPASPSSPQSVVATNFHSNPSTKSLAEAPYALKTPPRKTESHASNSPYVQKSAELSGDNNTLEPVSIQVSA
jgi:hypothetical protein